LGHLPQIANPNDPYTKESAAEHLIKHSDLFTAYFGNLRHFKQSVEQLSPTELLITKLDENATYDEHISTRLEFLHFIIANSNYQLMENNLEMLWDSFYANS
jgi:hypothetical protein